MEPRHNGIVIGLLVAVRATLGNRPMIGTAGTMRTQLLHRPTSALGLGGRRRRLRRPRLLRRCLRRRSRWGRDSHRRRRDRRRRPPTRSEEPVE